MKGNTGRILARLPMEVGTYLLNEKRAAIRDVEQQYDVVVIMLPSLSARHRATAWREFAPMIASTSPTIVRASNSKKKGGRFRNSSPRRIRKPGPNR